MNQLEQSQPDRRRTHQRGRVKQCHPSSCIGRHDLASSCSWHTPCVVHGRLHIDRACLLNLSIHPCRALARALIGPGGRFCFR